MKELDVIKLRIPVGSWKAGTTGTVLELWDGQALVEIAGEDGRTLELLTVPLDAAELLAGGGVPKRPKASQDVPGRSTSGPDVPARSGRGRLSAQG